MGGTAVGHRSVPHTADLCVQAWAPTREGCIAEAVLGTIESFVDIEGAHATGSRRCRLAEEADPDLLVAVLDEVVYLLDTAGEVPLDVELVPADGSIDVRFATVPVGDLPQVGAAPKGVSWHEISLGPGPAGWSCSVTLDV